MKFAMITFAAGAATANAGFGNRAFDITGTGVHYGFGSATPTEMGQQHDEYQCVTDGPDYYSNNEQATITVRRNGAINSKGTFHTEAARYDYLAIGGTRYGGSNAPMNVEVNQGDTFTWKSDYSVTRHGWTVCLEEYVAPTDAPTASPTDAPTASPTAAPTANVFSAEAQAQITGSLESAECNPTNCLEWNCEQWCECFNLDFEIANYYADMGCDQEDGDSSCEC